MRLRQYSHFDIFSNDLPAETISRRLGMAPDQAVVRASRLLDPPRPATHRWQIRCEDRGLCVDEQIERLVNRLAPLATEIGALAQELSATGSGGAVLQVARFFNDPDGEDDDGDYGVEGGEGQHQLLGWHLDHAVIEFLRRTHAELDVDEYG